MTDRVAPADYRQIADYLLSLLPIGRPRRVARMLDPGKDKYKDVPRHVLLDRAKLQRHASGVETWATTLDQDGMSRAGVIEVDQGGRGAVMAALAAAERLGLVCFAIAVDNPLSEHSGGHIWFIYDDWYRITDIRAQLMLVVAAAGLPADTETWPCGQVIRLPFAYHRWARTRGELLSQAGEVLDLGTDLAAGFALVAGLPLNSAPPAVQSSDKAHYAKSRHVATCPATRRETPGGRTSLADVKEQYNASHPPSELLADYGAVQHSGKDFSCPFCEHSHPRTLFVYNGRIFSRSPNCKVPQKRGLDPFGLYVLIEHAGDVIAALMALNLIPAAPAPELLDTRDEAERFSTQHVSTFDTDYVLTPGELERRKAEAQRKRVARAFHARETIADVRSRAERDPNLTKADRAVLDALLTIAGDREWCRPSKEQIAEISGVRLGTVKRAMFSASAGGRLEGRYFTSQGKGGGAKLTAIRTFVRGSIAPELIHESYSTCDLIPESVACEGGADPADLLERLSFASYLRNLAAELGEALDLAELAALSLAEQEACEARLIALAAGGDQLQAVCVAFTDGACYDPAADWTAGGRLDLSQWRDPLELEIGRASCRERV